MANNDKNISDLPEALALHGSDIAPIVQAGDPATTKKTSITNLGTYIATGIEVASLSTTDKHIVGAINEAAQSGGATELNELSDVTLTSPSAGQALVYDGTNSRWVNGNIETGAAELDDLTDVDLTTPSDGQVLIYDGTNDKWVNGNSSAGATELDELSDVTLSSSIVAGAVLQYQPTGPDTGTWTSSGYSPAFYMTQLRDVNIDDDYLDTKPFLMYDWDEDEWINTALSVSMIGDLDIDNASLGTNQTLMYDGGSGKWENRDIYLGSLSDNSNLKDVAMGGTTTEGDTLRYNAAINKWENAQMYYDVTGTLTAGSTQLILLYTQGSNIPLSTATVEVFTDTYGVNPTNVSIVGNNITLTFAAQANNVGVKVRVWR